MEASFNLSISAESHFKRLSHQTGVITFWRMSRGSEVSRVPVRHGPLEQGGLYAEWTLTSRREDEARKLSIVLEGRGAASFVTSDGVPVSGPEVSWDHEENWAVLVASLPAAASRPGPDLNTFLESRRRVVADAGGHIVMRGPGRKVRFLLPIETFSEVPQERWSSVAGVILDPGDVSG